MSELSSVYFLFNCNYLLLSYIALLHFIFIIYSIVIAYFCYLFYCYFFGNCLTCHLSMLSRYCSKLRERNYYISSSSNCQLSYLNNKNIILQSKLLVIYQAKKQRSNLRFLMEESKNNTNKKMLVY